MNKQIIPGKWTEELLDQLLREASEITDTSKRIEFLSAQFLSTKYKDQTLIGDINTREVLVINLEGIDCLTFIEYIEAMRRSDSFAAFNENLIRTRYRSGMIAFKNRNHFFTDWKTFNAEYIVDVTKTVAREKSKDVSKRLNEKHDGTFFVPGVSCRLREVTYIPSINIDDAVTGNLKTGDYIGIYSKKEGLDVSHAGILIKEQGVIHLRHASSAKNNRRVLDEDFRDYLKSIAGVIVFRPR